MIDTLTLSHVGLRPALEAQHLQPAAGAEVLGLGGDEPVEPGALPGAGVLGLIHDSGALVGGAGFVGEAAHRDQRLGDRRRVRATIERHLEVVAVALGKERRAGALRSGGCLLSGDPALVVQPVAAGAIDGRAGQADEVRDERSAARIVDQRRGAAASGFVVGPGVGRHAADARAVAVLVVADQPDAPSAPRECRHAIERQRRWHAIGRDRPDLAEHDVREASGKREDLSAVAAGLGDGRDRAVAVCASVPAVVVGER